jgi:hypothetical protein
MAELKSDVNDPIRAALLQLPHQLDSLRHENEEIRRVVAQQGMKIAELQEIIFALRDEVKKGRAVSTGNIRIIERPFRNGDAFNGIFSYLQMSYPGNWKGYVTASAPSVWGDNQTQYGPMNALDCNPKIYFHTKDEFNQWLYIDFKAMRATPTWYSLRTRGESNAHGPCTWKLAGSIDGCHWEILDEQSGILTFKELNVSSSFEVKKTFECRYLKFQQNGLNSHGANCLALSQFEIFGTLAFQS